jgi:hypothetical protein
VNCGWLLAANIAVDLTAWWRLSGLHDRGDLKVERIFKADPKHDPGWIYERIGKRSMRWQAGS